ncbi:MAG: ribonuclease HI, partial [Anaerolineaceae bacterium]|nr:ribonuclease HI [Anaerolineaceae bacterium]
ACIVALRALNHLAPVIIFSDSRYVVNAVEKGWARRWRKNGWMRLPDENGRPQRAENSDLWEEMLNLLERQPVEFRWVKGHASNPENERCDQLAVQAAHERNLPPDSGYKGACR